MRGKGAAASVGILFLSAFAASVPSVSAWEIDETATVVSIIDGDTFDSYPTGRIRLADIDAPEYYEPGYQEAKDVLSGLISGQTVYLDIDDVYRTDPYDRWVAVVYVRHNATHLRNVNQGLLDAGVAVVSDYTNEFDPSTWPAYVFYPIEAPPPNITASASPTEGDAPLAVAFAATASGGIPPYSFLWAFGDGGTSSLQNPSHTYVKGGTFTARVTVTDSARRSGTASVGIRVVGPPAVAVAATPSRGTVPLTVTFSATVSGGESPYSFEWNFGDDATSDLMNPSHTYTSEGVFVATAMVTDTALRSGLASTQIRVVGPLTTSISATPDQGAIPLTVSFAAIAAGGEPPYSFQWNFGDGTTSSLQNPTHTYVRARTYVVTLTVTEAFGSLASKSLEVTASGTSLPPSGEAPFPGVWTYVVVITVGGIVGTVITLRKWRRRKLPPSTSHR